MKSSAGGVTSVEMSEEIARIVWIKFSKTLGESEWFAQVKIEAIARMLCTRVSGDEEVSCMINRFTCVSFS